MLVIFDYDGVLVDTVEKCMDCFRDSVKETLPGEDAEKARKYFDEQKGRPLEEIAEELFGKKKARIVLKKHLQKEEEITSNNVAFEGVRKMAEKLLLEGHTIAISTSFMHDGVWNRVKNAGLDDLFKKELVVGWKKGFRKPDHVGYLLKQSGEKEAVFFDDGMKSVEELRERGVRAFHFGTDVKTHSGIVKTVLSVAEASRRQ